MFIVLLVLSSVFAEEKENKQDDKEKSVTYICIGAVGYYPRDRGDIYVQANNYVTVKGEYNIETIKLQFVEKVRKQYVGFRPNNGQVTVHICSTTKEARKLQRSMNKGLHSLHTRRVTFTKFDF
jgi:hypothetical protein